MAKITGMKKYLLPCVTDGVFLGAIVFFASSTVAVYYFGKTFPSYLIAFFCAAIVLSLYTLRVKRKVSFLNLKAADEKNMRGATQAMLLADDKTILTVFTDYFTKIGKRPMVQNSCLVFGENFVAWKIVYDPLTVNDVIECYKKTPQGKNLLLIGNEFSEKALTFASGFGGRIRAIPLSTVLPAVREYGCLPETDFPRLPEKKPFRAFFRNSFERKKGKKYALYGVLLLLLSNFVFYPVWYIASGCALVVYACAVALFAPVPETKDVFG